MPRFRVGRPRARSMCGVSLAAASHVSRAAQSWERRLRRSGSKKYTRESSTAERVRVQSAL
eukprot:3378686-Pleurochrysis_carterae.AAC.1